MKKNYSLLLSLATFAFGALFFTSCGDDETTPAPVPGFTYEMEGKTVTFTNTSTDAATYSWNFDDDSEASTEENPTHEFPTYGDYDVRLTATGDGGSETLKQTLSLQREIGIAIDGDFGDWADYDAAVSYTEGEGGFLTDMKLEWDGNYLYIYLKGTSEFAGWVDIYLNTDNDTATGAATAHYPLGCGADYLLEGDIQAGDFAALYADNADSDDWCWDVSGESCGAPVPVLAAESGLVVTSGVVANGDIVEMEFSIARAYLVGMSSEAIGIGINDYSKVLTSEWADWGYYAQIPHTLQDDSQLFHWVFEE